MSEQIKREFEAIGGLDSFKRVNATHPLDLYIGRDHVARYTLLLISPAEPERLFSSQIIEVRAGYRTDNLWALSFSLADENFMDLFCHFCSDIISSSQSIEDHKRGMSFVCGRYNKWQEMLKKNRNGVLTVAEIKGLIGELLFLRECLFPMYGIDVALKSWIGPEHADQDFVCPDKWYEVKSTTSGAECVRISSVEQLDSLISGELVIVYLDKTSQSDSEKITLNDLVERIDRELESFNQRIRLKEILIDQGYVRRDEYDEYTFRIGTIARYQVESNFPALRRKDLPSSVANANYMLSIPAISIFLKES